MFLYEVSNMYVCLQSMQVTKTHLYFLLILAQSVIIKV